MAYFFAASSDGNLPSRLPAAMKSAGRCRRGVAAPLGRVKCQDRFRQATGLRRAATRGREGRKTRLANNSSAAVGLLVGPIGRRRDDAQCFALGWHRTRARVKCSNQIGRPADEGRGRPSRCWGPRPSCPDKASRSCGVSFCQGLSLGGVPLATGGAAALQAAVRAPPAATAAWPMADLSEEIVASGKPRAAAFVPCGRNCSRGPGRRGTKDCADRPGGETLFNSAYFASRLK